MFHCRKQSHCCGLDQWEGGGGHRQLEEDHLIVTSLIKAQCERRLLQCYGDEGVRVRSATTEHFWKAIVLLHPPTPSQTALVTQKADPLHGVRGH